MEIDLMPMPSWALVSTNNGESENIPPLEPIRLHSVPQWGHTVMSQLRHTADEINNLRCQIQGDESEAYRIFMQMKTDYHKTETNLNLAITQAQQHAADATGAHFNLTTTQFAEVAAAHMALRRHVETITISMAEDEERRQTLLRDFAQQMEANQNVWIAYHEDQAAKQEKFNSDCQQWASEMTAREAKTSANQEKVKKDLQKFKRLQEQLRQDQVNASAISQQEREDMQKSLREELQSIGEELKVQFQSAQQSRRGIDVDSVIDSVLEQHARRGRVPLPNDDDTDSLYNLPPPPRSERSGRGSILRARTTESRGSSPPSGVIPPPGPPPGGSSSSSSSSDSESDRPQDLGKEISKLIRELRKKDKKNRISKRPEAIVLGKAPKMKEPEVFDGDRENYIPWMKAVKQYMTVRSIDFNNDATRIHWLGSLLKGDARQWHQNRVDTTEKECRPDTWPSYTAAMDHYFRDPHQKRNYTNKMARLHWKYKPGCHKTGLPADQWGIRMAIYQEKAQVEGEVLREIYDQAFPEDLACQAWTDVQDLDDPRYKHFKARLIKLATAKEQHKNMHEKPLLNMYQTSSEPKQEREKWKRDDDKKSNRSDKQGKKESTHTPRSDKERKFQNNREALAGVPQAEIDQHKADKASCWHCGRNSHHTLECFAKKTSKGTELATTVATVSKRTKRQRPSEDSEDEDDEPGEPVSKWPKKVAAVTQTVSETSPETPTRVWEVEDSELSDLN
jgi:hypothetical protein